MEEVLGPKGFSILSRIGRGTFGVVYKAAMNGEEFAVKSVEQASSCAPLVEKEIGVLRLLSHPSIVKLQDSVFHQPSDTLFIVMEFVSGGDIMGHLLHHPQLFTEALCRAQLFHLSCGLAYAHEVGVMHRDLKPENVLLQANWLPKLADFGFARTVAQHEVCRSLVGSPGYVAPEVSMQMPYGFAADVFSLGLVVADMLSPTGVCDWDSQRRGVETRQALRKQWPEGAAPVQPSPRFAALHASMLAQVPGSRPTMFHLAQALRKLAIEEPRPCALWDVPTSLATAPPLQKAVDAATAEEIAARLGYVRGSTVQVFQNGAWHKGWVVHISSTACPGAVQVAYCTKGKATDAQILICPWQFQELLRPWVGEDATAFAQRLSAKSQEAAARMQLAKGAHHKEVPTVAGAACNTGQCAVQ